MYNSQVAIGFILFNIPTERATSMSFRHSILNQAITRRRFAGISAAGFTVGAVSLPGSLAASAQSMDPFTFIRTMPETELLGQLAGQHVDEVGPIEADGTVWDALIQVPIKRGQWFHFTCEFDSAWSVLKAYGIDVPLETQVDIVGIDNRVVPYWEETPDEVIVYGGDIGQHFSGFLDENLMSRATGNAIRKVFEAHGLVATPAQDRPSIEQAVLAGYPVFFKSTVDFLPWRQARWISPEGHEYKVVFSNDHALTVIGFNANDVIIRDPLGPTSTNNRRPYQYRVDWERFLVVLGSQANDGWAVSPAAPEPIAVEPEAEEVDATPTTLSDGTGGADFDGGQD